MSVFEYGLTPKLTGATKDDLADAVRKSIFSGILSSNGYEMFLGRQFKGGGGRNNFWREKDEESEFIVEPINNLVFLVRDLISPIYSSAQQIQQHVSSPDEEKAQKKLLQRSMIRLACHLGENLGMYGEGFVSLDGRVLDVIKNDEIFDDFFSMADEMRYLFGDVKSNRIRSPLFLIKVKNLKDFHEETIAQKYLAYARGLMH